MAAVAENLTFAEPAPTKKGRSRKALKPKAVSSNEANIAAGAVTEPSPVAAKGKQQFSNASFFEKKLLEMQEQLEKLKIEKEQTEEMLKAKEEQLETRDREQEKLKIELRELQKIKEFIPTVKEKVSRQKKKNEEKTVDPNKPKIITEIISLKWKLLQLRFLICAKAMEEFTKELEALEAYNNNLAGKNKDK